MQHISAAEKYTYGRQATISQSLHCQDGEREREIEGDRGRERERESEHIQKSDAAQSVF